jgi:hypothetical protein
MPDKDHADKDDKDDKLSVFVAVYDSTDAALADLEAIENLHKDDLVGTYDAAVVDQEDGKPHIVKRMDRPSIRVIPEKLGFGKLSHKELDEAANELAANQAGLIVVGEVTLEKAFDKAVTRANKVLKSAFEGTTDELAKEMKQAINS